MRKQRRIAASLAAVLITTGSAVTDATAAEPAAARSDIEPLFELPTRAMTGAGFRFDPAEHRLAVAPPPPPAPAPPPRPAPVRASRARVVRVAGGDAFARLRQCESGGNYAANTGNGYYGAYQFSLSTWRGLGYGGYPHQASPATQDAAARQLQARSGWGQWPSCARKLGLR